jgi:hypothetical protein
MAVPQCGMHPVAFLPQVFPLLTDFGANGEGLAESMPPLCHACAANVDRRLMSRHLPLPESSRSRLANHGVFGRSGCRFA